MRTLLLFLVLTDLWFELQLRDVLVCAQYDHLAAEWRINGACLGCEPEESDHTRIVLHLL